MKWFRWKRVVPNKKGKSGETTHRRNIVVLLAMDAATRRFELVQLDLTRSSSARCVSDVVACAFWTEEVLRDQRYTGLVNPSGRLLKPADPLFNNDDDDNDDDQQVFVAIADKVSVNECLSAAREILSDEKVVAVVSASYYRVFVGVYTWTCAGTVVNTTTPIILSDLHTPAV